MIYSVFDYLKRMRVVTFSATIRLTLFAMDNFSLLVWLFCFYLSIKYCSYMKNIISVFTVVNENRGSGFLGLVVQDINYFFINMAIFF